MEKKKVFGIMLFTVLFFASFSFALFDKKYLITKDYNGASLNYFYDFNSRVSKLVAGTNITLACTGSDSNGECTINSTASGSGGRMYTGLSPIAVDNDLNIISFDNNISFNLDGGFANSVYLFDQNIDGGGA